MSLIPEILRNRVFVEESDEILVDIGNKIENGEKTVTPSSEQSAVCNFNGSNALADFSNISLDREPKSYTVDPSSSISSQTVMQPLRVALPTTSTNCDYISSPSVPVQNTDSQSVLNIKDLEYPTEIFPDVKSEENSVCLDSLDVESSVNVADTSERYLIDPLSSDAGLMEEIPPSSLNLPPPLQPVVIQSGKSEVGDKQA